MNNVNLNTAKKLEIIVAGEHKDFITDLLERAGVTGFTIIHGLSGKGSHGFHEGHFMFNEDESLIMIIAAVLQDKVEPILAGITPFFNAHTGVLFISDIQVSRLVKFKK